MNILAPLSGYTDKAFREICRTFGSDASVSEMVSAEGLARGSLKSARLLERFPGEENFTVQIFGSSEDSVERSIGTLLSSSPDSIDINCGCPVPKVVKTGAGSALMKTPEIAARMVKVLVENTGLPISVKFRLGWDSSSINYLEFAEKMASAGASALTLHARTRSQGYSGSAERKAFIPLVKLFKGTGVKIFASGDIYSPEDAVIMIEDYGVDGVMFARGAIGNPFIFRQSSELTKSGSYTETATEERIETAIKHLNLACLYNGEARAIKEMRKQIIAYVKGIPGASSIRNRISTTTNREETESLLRSLI